MKTSVLKGEIALLEPPLDTGTIWGKLQQEIRDLILNDDPEQFLTWATIINTMMTGDSPGGRHERSELQENYLGPWPRVPRFGLNKGARYGHQLRWTVWHQLYHLYQWSRWFGPISNVGSICEIGGGYGAMRDVARELHHVGDYTLVDLPEVLLLQEYYLTRIKGGPVTYRREVSDTYDMVIAANSVTEIFPTSARRLPVADKYIIVYRDSYGGVNNEGWLQGYLRDSQPHIEWHDYPHPFYGFTRYLVGCNV